MPLTLKQQRKVMTPAAAAALIKSGDCVTVSGTVGWMYPTRVLNALEERFLTTGEPRDLTWFEPFPTGAGDEPFSHPGMLRRVIGGWFTPHPCLQAMITGNQVEAYCFPLGSLSFLCQAMAQGRDSYLTKVGLDTYLDPRNGGGKLNEVTREDLVELAQIDGEIYVNYRTLPIHAAIIRGSVVDEAGNLSIASEHVTMNVLNQAMAAKRFGGIVIVQARKVVAEGHIPAREVIIPGVLVDAIVIDPHQLDDGHAGGADWIGPWSRVAIPPATVTSAEDPTAWQHWLAEGTVEADVLAGRPLQPDGLVARRALLDLQPGQVVNIGQGLPAREILPVAIEEGLDRCTELSIETGHLGGSVNGRGYRVNTTAILDTPSIFGLYASNLIHKAFFSMLEFDGDGNVNLLGYGDLAIGPGGALDIAEAVSEIIFCGTFRAGGLETTAEDGRLQIRVEGQLPRGVERVQAVCFNGRRMMSQGKKVSYVTERAVFRLTQEGIELIEVAPGIELERDVLAQMTFTPRIAPDLQRMDQRIFRPGAMGLLEHAQL